MANRKGYINTKMSLPEGGRLLGTLQVKAWERLARIMKPRDGRV